MQKLSILICLLLAIAPTLSAQLRTASGIVTGLQGTPLPGASILAKGTSIGTVSDSTGAYTLALPKGANVLIVQYVGYATREIRIGGQSRIDIRLEEQATDLEKVMVVGFGKQSRRRLTSAVCSVGEEAFDNVSVPTFQRALQGQMPGVVMTNASGGLNAESIIRIRGVGSISAGNQPLFVVDGLVLASRPDDYLGVSTNPLIWLSPADIASVNVLKDAAATAVYGARGANGVILITTKSGQYNRRPQSTMSYYAGFSEISKKNELLNGKEYAGLWNQAALNAGYTPDSDPALFFDVDAQPSADWQELLLQQGFVQEATASTSGGTANTRYYVGGSFRGEDGYLRTTRLQRYSLRANIEQRIGDQVRAGISINPSRTIDNRTGNQWLGSAWGFATWFRPNVEALDANGDCRRDPILGFPGNPCVVLEDQDIEGITSQVLASAHLIWSPLPGLRFRTELGIESYQVQQSTRFGSATFFGAPSGQAYFSNRQVFNYNWASLASWERQWAGKHHLAATAGIQLTRDRYEGQTAGAIGFADDRLSSLSAAAVPAWAESFRTEAAFLGYLTRVNYAFRNRYLLDVSARYDGSSRFGPGNRYGFFPALSAGWILSEEDFFPGESFDLLKFRSSIGLTGNAEIGNDPYRALVNFGAAYGGEPGYIIESLENESLGWEKSLQWDAGLDFSLWSGRLRGSLDYYIRDTRGLLLEQPVPAVNGISILTRNLGAVRNRGFEFDLSADILRGGFGWTLEVNGAILKNEVRQLLDQNGDGRQEDIILNSRMLFRPGLSVGSFFLVEYAGVDPGNGDALFLDLEGNRVTDAPSSNRRVVGKSLPSFTGGFTNTFRYGNFGLSAFFHFKAGYQIYWESSMEQNMAFGDNQRRSQLNAWTPDNRDTDVPQARLFVSNGTQQSTRYLKDGDYLRLQHLQLGYTFQGIGSGNNTLRLFAAVQNLLTFTRFPGLDPDAEFYAPESAAQGAIRFNLPAARTYTVGVSVEL
ncbi:MAG: TonB-dependent receptor [Phaeodactylibacter sp.]|nr:TonB-dependent receptor [Phaeodactylibacter sp.]MCB9052498.1 TonB-dependent receptor [Lewinellaceae bacterium]